MRLSRFLFCFAVAAASIGSLALPISAQEQKGGPPGGDRGRGDRGGPPRTIGGGGIPSLIMDPTIQAALPLDESQKQEVKSKIEAAMNAAREQFSAFRGGDQGRRPEGGRPEGGDRPRPEGGPGGPGGGGRGPGGPGGFGMSEEQQKEFETKMTEFRDKQEAEIMGILDPDQTDKILGVLIKAEEARSLSSPTLRELLKITDDQKSKLKAANDNMAKERREMFASMMEQRGQGGNPGGGFDAMREKMEAMNQKANTAMLAVLTAEQKTEYEALKAKAADIAIPERRGPGGPPGGIGGPGGPGGGFRGGPGGTRGGEGDRPGRPERAPQ